MPIERLYEYRDCREISIGDWGVGRVIARPEGEYPNSTEHQEGGDFSPTIKITMLDTQR